MPKRSCSSLFTLFYPNLLADVQPREREIDETLYNVHISSRLRCNWSRSSSSRRRRRAAEAGAARMVTKITLKHHGG